MMTLFDTIILGLVEGITEFLPVSSTGHLILVSSLLGIITTDTTKTFEIAIQCGAILAVIIFYARKILASKNLIGKIIVGFIPTAIAGLLLYSVVKKYLLGNVLIVSIALIVGGVVLYIVESKKKEEIVAERDVTYKEAFLLGLWQILAFVPGVSRSGATIIGGRLHNIPKKTIIEFSFLLAIPTLGAATALDLLHSYKTLVASDISMLLVGAIIACITALFSIKFLLAFIQKNSLKVFGIYRIVIGIIFLTFFLLK